MPAQAMDPMDVDDARVVFDFERYFEADSYGNGGEEGGADSSGVCKFFLKGSCTKGHDCPYKHSRGEKGVVCKHWLRGLCKKGDVCEFLHEYDLSKMAECYFFTKFGECNNPDCLYLHINPESKMRECPWYARGFCKHGPQCRNKHIKKTACALYLDGFCPYGSKCEYGHPKFELPKEEDTPGKRARTPIICHKCGTIGHKASACPMQERKDDRAPRPLETVTCFKCGEMGHYANHCHGVRKSHPAQGLPVQ